MGIRDHTPHRVTSYKFDKDGLHTVYKIEKTQASGASRAMRYSSSVEDVPESSRSRLRKEKKMEKFRRWLKATFITCTYVARTAYEDRLENREANREAREHAGLPPLSPVQSPPRFDNLPSLFDTYSEAHEEEQEQPELDPQTRLTSTLQSMRRSTRHEHHTSTTHHQGRVVVSSSSDDDDDGDLSVAAGGGRATGGDDVYWVGIQ